MIAVQLVDGKPPNIDHFINAFKEKKETIMAHHKSALKRVRQTIKRTAQKRSQRADLLTVIKKFLMIFYGVNMDQALYL